MVEVVKVNLFEYAYKESFDIDDLLHVVSVIAYDEFKEGEEEKFFSYELDLDILVKAGKIIDYFDFNRGEEFHKKEGVVE